MARFFETLKIVWFKVFNNFSFRYLQTLDSIGPVVSYLLSQREVVWNCGQTSTDDGQLSFLIVQAPRNLWLRWAKRCRWSCGSDSLHIVQWCFIFVPVFFFLGELLTAYFSFMNVFLILLLLSLCRYPYTEIFVESSSLTFVSVYFV